MSDSRVDFVGSGPFGLPAAQQTTARALSGAVQATLYAVVGDDPAPRPITFQMTRSIADNFAVQLLEAVANAK